MSKEIHISSISAKINKKLDSLTSNLFAVSFQLEGKVQTTQSVTYNEGKEMIWTDILKMKFTNDQSIDIKLINEKVSVANGVFLIASGVSGNKNNVNVFSANKQLIATISFKHNVVEPQKQNNQSPVKQKTQKTIPLEQSPKKSEKKSEQNKSVQPQPQPVDNKLSSSIKQGSQKSIPQMTKKQTQAKQETKETKQTKEMKQIKQSKQIKQAKEIKQIKQPKQNKQPKLETKQPKLESKQLKLESKQPKLETKQPKQESKQSKQTKQNKQIKQTKQVNQPKQNDIKLSDRPSRKTTERIQKRQSQQPSNMQKSQTIQLSNSNMNDSSLVGNKSLNRSRDTLKLPNIGEVSKNFGDKIYQKQSSATLQKSILVFSVPKAQRFNSGPKYAGEPSYYVDTCFKPNASKGVGFGFGNKRQFPQWLEKNMKQNPAPGAYFDQGKSTSHLRTRGPTFGISYKFYEKVTIPKEKSPERTTVSNQRLKPIFKSG